MALESNLSTIADEVRAVVSRIDATQVEQLVERIVSANTIVVLGVGREGLMGRAFAMRLAHLGLRVHWAWSDTAPAVRGGDLLIAVSGSGEIGHIDYVAQRARQQGAALAVVTAVPAGNTPMRADVVLAVPGEVYEGGDADVVHSIQPMGSLFEQCVLITLDAVVLEVAQALAMDIAAAAGNHRNYE